MGIRLGTVVEDLCWGLWVCAVKDLIVLVDHVPVAVPALHCTHSIYLREGALSAGRKTRPPGGQIGLEEAVGDPPNIPFQDLDVLVIQRLGAM